MSNTTAAPKHSLTLADLDKAGGGKPRSEQPVIFEGHQFGGTAAFATKPLESIPAYKKAVESEYEQVEQKATFTEALNDVLVCAARVAKRLHGGISRSVRTSPFKLPQEVTIEVGYDHNGVMQYETVPGDWMNLPGLDNTIMRVRQYKPDEVTVEFQYPRILKHLVDGFIRLIHEELDNASIYRGKIITQDYKYVWVAPIDPNKIVYNDDVQDVLGPWALSTILNVEANDKVGVSNKVGVCLAGPPGTGKSLFLQLILHTARTNGNTCVVAPPGSDIHGLSRAFEVARRYMIPGQVSVVVAEDIEKLAGTPDARAALLDLLDGAQAKSNRSLFITTTNFPDHIDPAMIRPGRIDQLIMMKLPDLPSFTKLLQIQLGDMLHPDVDFEAAFPHYEGYTQSWITGSTESVLRAAVWRTGSADDLIIRTEDLIRAAKSYRAQYEMQLAAEARVPETPTLDQAMRATVGRAFANFAEETGIELEAHVDYDTVKMASADAIDRKLDGAPVELTTDRGAKIKGTVNTK